MTKKKLYRLLILLLIVLALALVVWGYRNIQTTNPDCTGNAMFLNLILSGCNDRSDKVTTPPCHLIPYEYAIMGMPCSPVATPTGER